MDFLGLEYQGVSEAHHAQMDRKFFKDSDSGSPDGEESESIIGIFIA